MSLNKTVCSAVALLPITFISLHNISVMMQYFTCYPTDIWEICLTFAQHLNERFRWMSYSVSHGFAYLGLFPLQATHEGQCDFMIIPCPSCKELLRANELERHNERECPERTLNCKYCKEPFHFKNIKVKCLVFTYWMIVGQSQNVYTWWRRKKLNLPWSIGPWWDLSKIPDDLRRLCEEENSQREGE